MKNIVKEIFNVNKIKWLVLIILVLFLFAVLGLSYGKYSSATNNTFLLNARKPIYTINFYPGTKDEEQKYSQEFSYGTAQNLLPNQFTKLNYNFLEWNTEEDGSGDSYADKESVLNLSSVDGAEIDLYAQWIKGIARIGNNYYTTLSDAIADVPTDGTETLVELLANTSDNFTISNQKNVILDLKGHILSNLISAPVIENNGTLKIPNGTIRSNALTAAINNNKNSVLEISGASIYATNTKQALYNKGGQVTISGNTYLSSTSTNRYTLHNLSDGVAGRVTILGGTIECLADNTSAGAVLNESGAILTIGNKDGNVDTSTPVIQGLKNGVNNSGTLNFYDGRVRAKNESNAHPFNNENNITDKETDYLLEHSTVSIGGVEFEEVYLLHEDAEQIIITLITDGGTLDNTTIPRYSNHPLGSLPEPTKYLFAFDGWYDAPVGGNEITSATILTDDTTIYAHWISKAHVEVNGVQYETIAEAMRHVPDNETVTLTLLQDTNEAFKISRDQNVVINLNGFVLTNDGYNEPIINNFGHVTTINGRMETHTQKGAIDNKAGGTLIVDGAEIYSYGGRQALFNEAGSYMEIKGGSYLYSNAAGYALDKPENLERATVNNLAGGTVVILDATIECSVQSAVAGRGSFTIGTAGGSVSTSNPVLIGMRDGIHTTGNFEFYDGIIKGLQNSINGTTPTIESGATLVNDTEIIDGDEYQVSYLQ